MEKNSNRLVLVDLLRGVAIIGVLCQHLLFSFYHYNKNTGFLTPVSLFLSSGWLGVNLFFFLSGFVLYLPYAEGRRKILRLSDIKDFYKRRTKRLLPLYYFMGLVSIVVTYNSIQNFSALCRWFFLHAFVLFPFSSQTFMPVYNGMMWSIGVEIWLSILFPFIVVYISRFGFKKMLILSIVLSFSIKLAGQYYYSQIAQGNILNFVSDSFLGRLDDFSWGICSAGLFHTKFSSRKMFKLAWLYGPFFIISAMILWGLWYRQQIPAVSQAFFSTILNFGIFSCFMFLIGTKIDWASYKILQPLSILGIMCYSIYLWHGPVLVQFQGHLHSLSDYVAYLAFTILLSVFTAHYIEFGCRGKEKEIKYFDSSSSGEAE